MADLFSIRGNNVDAYVRIAIDLRYVDGASLCSWVFIVWTITYETLYCERLILVVRTISYVCNFVLRTIISVLRTINFVLRTIIFVLWTINLVMRTINFVLRTGDYVVLYYGRLRT